MTVLPDEGAKPPAKVKRGGRAKESITHPIDSQVAEAREMAAEHKRAIEREETSHRLRLEQDESAHKRTREIDGDHHRRKIELIALGVGSAIAVGCIGVCFTTASDELKGKALATVASVASADLGFLAGKGQAKSSS